MQNTISATLESHTSRGGGRIASAQYRQSLEVCQDFAGLEEDTNRYDLLLLVKRAGKAAGFTPRMIQLLDYYMAFTRDLDWEQGSRPIVYQSLARTALDMGVSERQIQKLEKQLFDLGAITWNDSGNHKRYGQRHARTGQILFAYGVDLTPLAYLKAELTDKLHEKQLHDRAWMETKRQISWYRRQIRSMILEWEQEEGACGIDRLAFERSYEAIAVPIRTYIPLEDLRALLDQHKRLHESLATRISAQKVASESKLKTAEVTIITHKGSSRDEPEFAHYKSTTQEPFDKSNTNSPADQCFQKSVAKPPEPKIGFEQNEAFGKRGKSEPTSKEELILATGLQHIRLKQVLQASSNRFREHLPLSPRPMNWADVIEAAYRLRSELHISQQSWAEACELLGRAGASVCILLTDQATQRPNNPVHKPAAYFRSMINRAKTGQLRLHNSVFGAVTRCEQRENH